MPTENSARDAGVDLHDLMVRVDHDRDLLREIFQLFEEEFPPLFARLGEAAQGSDLQTVRIAAHTLKGMLAGLSFTAAASSAKIIEQMAEQQNLPAMQSELSRLLVHVETARKTLARICNEVAA